MNDAARHGDQIHRVKVIDRAVAIMDAFSIDTPELGVVELARLTSLSKGTVHRLLASLEDNRLVEQNPDTKRYRLGVKLFDLGSRTIARIDHVRLAEPFLHELVRETGETANLAVLDQGMILYIAKVEGWHSLRMPSQVGMRLNAHCTALGKVLLAFAPDEEAMRMVTERGLTRKTPNTITDPRALRHHLDHVRDIGYAIDNEELEAGLRCVAAPVRDYTDSVVAAISVAGPTTRMTVESTEEIVAKVVGIAESISRAFGKIEDSKGALG